MKKLIFLILLFILLAASVAAVPGAGGSCDSSHCGMAPAWKAGQ